MKVASVCVGRCSLNLPFLCVHHIEEMYTQTKVPFIELQLSQQLGIQLDLCGW